MVYNINSNLGGTKLITEGSGASAKYYIQIGADAASKKPLGSGGTVDIIYFNSVTKTSNTKVSVNISPYYSNYKNLTADNLYVERVRNIGYATSTTTAYTLTKTYDASTGLLTLTYTGDSWATTATNNALYVLIVLNYTITAV